MITILVVLVLIVLLAGGVGTYRTHYGGGYVTGAFGLLFLIVLVWLILSLAGML